MLISESAFICQFERGGFEYQGVQYRPCRTRYHLRCVRLGHPFRTRLPSGRGMSMPPLEFYPFVCEACTVRTQLRRELTRSTADQELLMLERARMIDSANHLAPSTWKQYSASFRRFARFEVRHPGIGAISLQLLPETKTNRTSRADQYISYCSASGLTCGYWLDELMALHVRIFGQASGPVFRYVSGDRWSSTYFRHNYLYPWLEQQRQAGDPMLQQFDPNSDKDSIPARFFSMGCYRRGGRSHVTKKRPGCIRKATPLEIYEHGRWAITTGTEAAPIHYNEPSIPDKLDITLLCM